ncbi:MAG: flagellar hook-associated protein FlgK [Lachnospiraceae bacterium]|nr:flagellar hook-associated protein FlgK [Lachnospiraceae bacterium]
MAGMTSIYVGVSGLHSAQTALNTTTHNLANVYTKGYTRQLSINADRIYNTVGQGATSAMQVGLGVATSVTSRVRDILLDSRYRTEVGRQGFYEAQYDATLEIQTILGETEGVRFQDSIEKLWSAFGEMAKTPDSIVSRSELVMYADTFITRAQSVYKELAECQKNLNTKVQNTVDRINELGDKINELNLKIGGIEATVENANDMRDQRDLYLDELAKYINISYEETPGHYVLVKAEGIPFVSEGGVFHMATAQLDAEKNSTYLSCIWPHVDNQEVFSLEQEISTANKNDIGQLKGYLLARGDFVADYTNIPETSDYDVSTPDGLAAYMAAVREYNKKVDCCSIAKTQALFDKLINRIVTTINDVFSPTTTEVPAGVTSYTDADGNVYDAATVKILDMTTSTGDDGVMPPEELFSRKNTQRFIEVTGDDGNTYYMYNDKNTLGKESLYTLSNIELNQTIREDYSKLPFKTVEKDNDLKKGEVLMNEWGIKQMNLDPSNMSKLTFKEFYAQLVYTIGNIGELYGSVAANQADAAAEVDDARTVITGVSSEEELANMIKFQSAYNASSRYVTVVADMLEYLIEKLG